MNVIFMSVFVDHPRDILGKAVDIAFMLTPVPRSVKRSEQDKLRSVIVN